jgi:SAM-dependent methyltransferase
MTLGREFSECSEFNCFERIYIKILGMPILGLRIRAWRMLPKITQYAFNAGRVLDIGSGRGVFTIEIAKHLPYTEVIGVDKEYKEKVDMANAVARKIGLSNCSFEMIDIFDKQFNKKFDAIIAIDVLEHIKNDREVIKKLHALLNEKGKLIIHVPHYYRNVFGRKTLNFSDIEGHERIGYLLEDLEKLLFDGNFTILEQGYTYSSFETLANNISYLITGGREKNKLLYSAIFPILLTIAFLGKRVIPTYGSGIYMIAEKNSFRKEIAYG